MTGKLDLGPHRFFAYIKMKEGWILIKINIYLVEI